MIRSKLLSGKMMLVSQNLNKISYIQQNDEFDYLKNLIKSLEKGSSFEKLTKGNRERQVKDVRIEDENMNPIQRSYNQIIGTYKNLIARIKFIFR